MTVVTEKYVRCMGRHDWAVPETGDDRIRCGGCGREIMFGNLDDIRRNSIEAAQIRHNGETGEVWVDTLRLAIHAHYAERAARIVAPEIVPLVRAKCHLVLASPEKIPIRSGWNVRSAGAAEAALHYREGGLVGIVPGRSGLIVVDVDEGGEEAVRIMVKRYPPLETVKTPNGYHLYYARGKRIWYHNAKWSEDGFAGDLRGDAGYVVAWQPDLIERAALCRLESPGQFQVPEHFFET